MATGGLSNASAERLLAGLSAYCCTDGNAIGGGQGLGKSGAWSLGIKPKSWQPSAYATLYELLRGQVQPWPPHCQPAPRV